MKYTTLITVISIVSFMYSVYSDNTVSEDTQGIDDNAPNNSDYFIEDDGGGEIFDDGDYNQSSNDLLKDLEESDLYKFLNSIDDEAFEDGTNSFVGKANEDTYCYAHDREPYNYFSTKTRYPEYNDTSSLDPPPGCEVVYVWLMMRHGVRYGSWSKTYDYYTLSSIRDEIIRHATENKTEMCLDDIFNLLLWTPMGSENEMIKPETLTESGYQLMNRFGKLLKEKFSHLIPPEYDEKKIKIQFSDEIKVNQSVEALTDVMFGKAFLPEIGVSSENIFDKVYVDDCKKPDIKDRETGDNFTYVAETSPYTLQMVHEVSQRLGYETDLTYRDVSKIYNGCQYEIAWGLHKSPWCAAFRKEDLQIMEFIGDISYYYFCGPGNVYNIFQGCVLLKDFFQKLKNATNEDAPDAMEKITLYVGHSTTILFLVTQLGLVQEPDFLSPRNYHGLGYRKWRTSLIAPYAGNVMAILHKCSTGEKYRVKFLLNQKPFTFVDLCDEETALCSLEKIYEVFEPIITSEECSSKYCTHTPDEMCKYLKYGVEDCDLLKGYYNEMVEKEKKQAEERHKNNNMEETDYLESIFRSSCILLIIMITILCIMCCKLDRRLERILRRVCTTKSKTIEENKSTKKDEVKKEIDSKKVDAKKGTSKVKTNDKRRKTIKDKKDE